MKHFIAALFVVAPFLLIGGDAGATGHDDWDRLQRQEGCENYCIECLASGEGVCMGIFRMCCSYYGGKPDGSCGCRTEL